MAEDAPSTTVAPPAPVPDGPRYTKGARTRQRIVDAALELFAENGFQGTSVRDVAARVGLTHAGVLQHFDGKDGLLIDVLKGRDEREAGLQAAARRAPGDIVGFVRDLLDREIAEPALVALYVKIASEATNPDHPAHQYFVDRYRRIRRDTAAAFRTYLDHHPEVPAFDVELAAQQAIAMLDGIQVQWLLDPDAVDMQGTIEAWLAAIGVTGDA